MIDIDKIETLYDRLWAIIEYGINNNYSFASIQDFISFSDMFRNLENGDASFLYRRNVTEEVSLVYKKEVDDEELTKNSSIYLWISEAYLKLFFKYHKSIYYIFLYIPIEEMIGYYRLYHEMDWTQLFSLFEEKTNSVSLMKKLIEKSDLSSNRLSQLTGISESSIKRYSSNDKYLYEAKYSHIDALSMILKINSNVFLKEVHNYLDTSGYETDKNDLKYRNYLGLYLASYYSLDVIKNNYRLNETTNIFENNGSFLKVLWTKSAFLADYSMAKNQEIIRVVDEYSKVCTERKRKKTTLVIFEYNQISKSVKPYLPLLDYNFYKIFVINEAFIMCIYKNYWISAIPYNVKTALIEKTKKESGGTY